MPADERGRTRNPVGSDGSRAPSEAFKSRPDYPSSMESIILDEEDEMLAPAVVVATIALIGVFAIGLLYQAIGLII